VEIWCIRMLMLDGVDTNNIILEPIQSFSMGISH
jgi:hypothetical protein